MARGALIDRWFQLTREEMPAFASIRKWPVRDDHCFQRILLDNAVGGLWRDHIAALAWRGASDDQLAAAIALGEAVLAGAEDITQLNRRSLAWRGKLPRHA